MVAIYGRIAQQTRTFYFTVVISSSFFLLISSPILSGCRLDVYHTSTHAVVLVRIYQDIGLKCAARGQLKIHDAIHAHRRTNLSGYMFPIKVCVKNRKKLLNSNISSICPHSMMNFGPLMVEIISRVWSTPANFNVFRVLAPLLHRRRSTEVNQTR